MSDDDARAREIVEKWKAAVFDTDSWPLAPTVLEDLIAVALADARREGAAEYVRLNVTPQTIFMDLQQRIEELEGALRDAIYQVTHLATSLEDGKYRTIIMRDTVDFWRAALAPKDRAERGTT